MRTITTSDTMCTNHSESRTMRRGRGIAATIKKATRPPGTTTKTATTTSPKTPSTLWFAFLVWISLASASKNTFANAQFNEPPGQRREQTYRIVEFEASNINQHYPGILRYYCTFRGKWSKERHPNDFPGSASWSAPVLVSHSKDWRMWTGTETVTAGVEYIAEEGFPTVMYNEFQNAGYETLQMVIGERMYNTTESQHLPPINVTYSHPWLSSMVKITPSPDWFVGFSDFRSVSYDTETFFNRVVIQSYVWDAGTDEGESYLAFDRDLDPQVPCMRFCVPPYAGPGGEGNADSNVAHNPGADRIHHPTGNTHRCPDKDKGRTEVPRGGQFLDYSASYIPYPAEFECVLRVGDGEVYAGNPFNETQIRPPKFVARPDDDFLEGISPYDQPAYDNYVESLLPPVEEDDGDDWNKDWLWLLLLLLLCFCPCVCIGMYLYCNPRKRRGDNESQFTDTKDLFLDDESSRKFGGSEAGVAGDGSESFLARNASERSSGSDYYGNDSGYGFEGDNVYEDDYDKWLASQRGFAVEEDDDPNGGDVDYSDDVDEDGEEYGEEFGEEYGEEYGGADEGGEPNQPTTMASYGDEEDVI
mmetsp:Transcript_29159/g.62487  ORF Transcript_29159/g.62487 Transcript_29159/m.62487 type:complete len:588 (+) Transcript_29159:179-1942(+)